MLRKMILTVFAAALAGALLPGQVSAYGGAHVGYTHVGPNGCYHVGATEVHGGYGGGGGAAYGGARVGGAYGGGGAAYGGYHYSAGYAGGAAGGAAVGGAHYGYVR
jgi:hypothetical protein